MSQAVSRKARKSKILAQKLLRQLPSGRQGGEAVEPGKRRPTGIAAASKSKFNASKVVAVRRNRLPARSMVKTTWAVARVKTASRPSAGASPFRRVKKKGREKNY
ncbi:MAG: hypothetical protein H5T99_02290 [Moorella sp. (in: Bacteria)]|nr:hypothetical protein [Moorella sp. (in: firmicutes)]